MIIYLFIGLVVPKPATQSDCNEMESELHHAKTTMGSTECQSESQDVSERGKCIQDHLSYLQLLILLFRCIVYL